MLYHRLSKYINRGFTITNIKEYVQIIEDVFIDDPWMVKLKN